MYLLLGMQLLGCECWYVCALGHDQFMHGGGMPVVAGTPLAHEYTTENVELVTKGCCNLARHMTKRKNVSGPSGDSSGVGSGALQCVVSGVYCSLCRCMGKARLWWLGRPLHTSTPLKTWSW